MSGCSRQPGILTAWYRARRMFRSYKLQPLRGEGDSLVFEWDPDTGGIRGSGAPYVRQLAQLPLLDGVALGHPYPTPYPITDPLRKPAELAVILGNAWHLPDDLARAYPCLAERDGLPGGIIAREG